MKNTLIGWLAAQGVALANEASDQQVIQAVQKKLNELKQAANASALSNSNERNQVAALENERTTLTAKNSELTVALENERTARKNDRTASASAVVDSAIRLGIVTVADRDAKITALSNSADFAKDAETLLKQKPANKTMESGTDLSGRQQAALGNETVALQNEYNAALQAELMVTGQNAVKAHHNIMTLPKYSGLAAKLAPKKA